MIFWLKVTSSTKTCISPVWLISISQLAHDTDENSSLSTGGNKSIFDWNGVTTTVSHTSPSGVPFLQACVGNPPHLAFYNICNLVCNCAAPTDNSILSALQATMPSRDTVSNQNEETVSNTYKQVSDSANLQSLEDIDFNSNLDDNINHFHTLMCAPLLSDKQWEYTLWHYRLGHLSHLKLQELVTLGKLPFLF
jgi:hypothetical protein